MEDTDLSEMDSTVNKDGTDSTEDGGQHQLKEMTKESWEVRTPPGAVDGGGGYGR